MRKDSYFGIHSSEEAIRYLLPSFTRKGVAWETRLARPVNVSYFRPMGLFRIICVSLLVIIPCFAHAQEKEVPASSATDNRVKVHTGKRIKATTPPKKFRPRFREKNKKAVNVSEKPTKVQTNTKRQQKRRNKLRRSGGGD